MYESVVLFIFFFQAEDGIRDYKVTGVQTCALPICAVGSMQRLLETCIRYANERKQGGQSIGKFQLVASKIVDMKVRVESSRHMLYHYAWLSGHRKAVYLEAAMTKLHISDCWVKCCEDAIQIHGGYGYMTEYEAEREVGDAIGSKLYSGTSEIQRNIVASMLGL